MDIAHAQSLLTSRETVVRRGGSGGKLAAQCRSGELVRVARGRYIRADAWDSLHSEDRHLLKVLAVAARGEGIAHFSHVSAAVLHGLPLYGPEPERVHITHANSHGNTGKDLLDVAKHRAELSASDRVCIDGVYVTGLARTVADVLRTAEPATALVVADAALRRAACLRSDRAYDDVADAEFRAEVGRRLPVGGRGVRQARSLLEWADGRAESPGESVSRLHMRDLGFERPRLQVPVPSPRGRNFYLDFGLDDANVWGEYDGESKYRDAELRGGRSLDEVLREEKARHDWIVGTTGRRILRWGSADIRSAQTFRVLLARFHLRPN